MPPNITIELLRAVAENDCTVPDGMSLFEFIMSIRTNLRSPDPELRDKLTYSILCELLDRNQLEEHQMAELLTMYQGTSSWYWRAWDG